MLDLSTETEALARSLAKTRRVSIDAAVRSALEAHSRVWLGSEQVGKLRGLSDGLAEPRTASLRRLREDIASSAKKRDMSPEGIAARAAASDRIVAEIKQLPILDSRSIKDIVDDINSL